MMVAGTNQELVGKSAQLQALCRFSRLAPGGIPVAYVSWQACEQGEAKVLNCGSFRTVAHEQRKARL